MTREYHILFVGRRGASCSLSPSIFAIDIFAMIASTRERDMEENLWWKSDDYGNTRLALALLNLDGGP